jgi:tetratricopeptide (TPR) repeat protein
LTVNANKPDNITEAEMALIPAYCKDANTFGYGGTADSMSPNAPKWVAMMGKGFWSIHHYCWALINLMRIQSPTAPPNVKQFVRETALGDLDYVIQNSPTDFILLPEIFTKKGQIQLDLKDPVAANASFAKARSIKPDYWPAYTRWARYLQFIGQKADAKQLAEEGLSYSPDSIALRELLTELGGDPKTVKRKINAKGSALDSEPPIESTAPSEAGKQ